MEKVEVKGETIYLKKSFFGWGVIHPLKIDGKINWKNVIAGGHWGKLALTIGFCILLVGAIFEYSNAVQIANECLQQNNLIKIFP